jgi:DNA mismatch repair ATPase MutS
MVINSYQSALIKQKVFLDTLTRQSLKLSITRFILFGLLISNIWFYFSSKSNLLIASSILILGIFIWLINLYNKKQWEIKIIKKKIDLLNAEIVFLQSGNIENDNGSSFIDGDHPYSYDLDIFGSNSLFQHINRSITFGGKENLAIRLSKSLHSNQILDNQHAITELSTKTDFRLQFLAIGSILSDDKIEYERLLDWLKRDSSQYILNKSSLNILSIIPLLSYGLSMIFDYKILTAILYSSITANIILLLYNFKKIQKEITISQKIIETTKKYGLLLEIVEKESFKTKLLQALQEKLTTSTYTGSEALHNFSRLLSSLDSIHNLLPATLVNSVSLYHLHQYNALIDWKKNNNTLVNEWVNVISDFDALQSFAGFSYNNPAYVMPNISDQQVIQFKELGHPLISNEHRINNNIGFNNTFYILTGSNMSGKSTFLRTIGLNLVLAMAGAKVCASSAEFYAVNLWTSMRQNDALHKNYSYFFSEVQRLKIIFNHFPEENLFILLDEILKGTNSEDKLHGSLEVSKKILQRNINGVIATHDIEVADLTQSFPNAKAIYFQSNIVNNDITFDYQLRDGICTSKSATFLLKREGVI